MTRGPRKLLLSGLAVAILTPPSPTLAQDAPGGGPARPDRGLGDSVAVLVVNERPWTPTVAVVVSFMGGSGDDPDGGEGASWLLGMILGEMARAELATIGARVRIDVEQARTLVTMLASPEDWEVAYGALMQTLSLREMAPSVVDATREDLLAQLTFQRGAPVRAFELETERLLLGAFHPFARPATGSVESVNGLGLGTLTQIRRQVYDSHRAAVAVVGPVGVDTITAVLRSGRTIGPRLEPAEAEVSQGESERAWSEGERYTVANEVTNSWIVAAYPFSSDSLRTDFEFLSYSLQRELSPDPPPPGLFHLSVEVRDLPDGPVVLVVATIESRTAPTWERRIVNTAQRLRTTVMSEHFFDRHRRSFRSATAIRLATPEEEARRMLDDAQRSGSLRDVRADIALLSRDRLQRVASMLGEPRVLVFGPGRSQGSRE